MIIKRVNILVRCSRFSPIIQHLGPEFWCTDGIPNFLTRKLYTIKQKVIHFNKTDVKLKSLLEYQLNSLIKDFERSSTFVYYPLFCCWDLNSFVWLMWPVPTLVLTLVDFFYTGLVSEMVQNHYLREPFVSVSLVFDERWWWLSFFTTVSNTFTPLNINKSTPPYIWPWMYLKSTVCFAKITLRSSGLHLILIPGPMSQRGDNLYVSTLT